MNLPILKQLEGCKRILLAGMGGGFDVFGALPLMHDLQALGKEVVLASLNTSSCKEFTIFDKHNQPHTEMYPESNLKLHFHSLVQDVQMYVFPKVGAAQIATWYRVIFATHGIDAVILVDGGIDSLMRGDEEGCGTLLEDSISLAALAKALPYDGVKVAIMACVGFGTELEEKLDHYRALENMADVICDGGFYGVCALTNVNDKENFEAYGTACESVWKDGRKSHIHTRVISSVIGMFGDQNAYGNIDARVFGSTQEENFITPLMSLYWFFDFHTIAKRSLVVEAIKNAVTFTDTLMIYRQMLPKLMENKKERKRLPY